MINEVEGERLEKKCRSTWPSYVKVIKTVSGGKSATKDFLSILEKLYQNKTADHLVRRTRRE
jgi:hypothetical protein